MHPRYTIPAINPNYTCFWSYSKSLVLRTVVAVQYMYSKKYCTWLHNTFLAEKLSDSENMYLAEEESVCRSPEGIHRTPQGVKTEYSFILSLFFCCQWTLEQGRGGRVEAHLYKKIFFAFLHILFPVFASANIILSDSFHVFIKNLTWYMIM